MNFTFIDILYLSAAYDYFEGRERDIGVEHLRRVANQIALRKQLRHRTDPFEISISEFIRLYRMPQDYCMDLVEIIRPYLRPKIRSTFVPVEIKVNEPVGMNCRYYFMLQFGSF